LLSLDIELKATFARWWVAHKEKIEDWKQCRRLLQVIFGARNEYISWKHTRLSYPTKNVT
jgi:hypothetical protein